MNFKLLSAVRRFAESNADEDGIARSPIPGLSMVRATRPSGLDYAISRPLVCLLLQGSKLVTTGRDTLAFNAGDSLLITADVPTISQITQASASEPYLSLILDVDVPLATDLAMSMKAAPPASGAHVRIERTDEEVSDAALRLIRLIERPGALPILKAQLLREMHYWLLAGRHGPAMRKLGFPEGHLQRVARAVAVLRADYTSSLPVERLAAAADMSPSSFYQHFRAVTSLSPLQFQKQLRLIEARRLMMTDGISARSAAFAVGYESVPQFTREYHRKFGRPPVQDVSNLKRAVHTAAGEST
jgi:AraC-like DNA-binding protein